MTHFNHDWDTTKTPAVPVSVGDRYYAQDLNDDFNYLKHLPYEVFLQGRSRGVMIVPNDTWDSATHSLTLSGGFGVVLQDCIELDPNEDFTIPPKTHSSSRYERIPFVDTTLVIPNDSTLHYIVATPTKRSFLQRTKALFAEQYASRVRYDGVITIQDTAPTTGQILVGLFRANEYCLLVDNDLNQCKDNIILKKWWGSYNITQNFIPVLQSYYNTTIDSIETEVSVDATLEFGSYRIGIANGIFNNCTISIGYVNSLGNGIGGGVFNNCVVNVNNVNGLGIAGGTFNNCIINITFGSATQPYGIAGGTFNNCIATIEGGIGGGVFNNCTVSVPVGRISSVKFNFCIVNGAENITINNDESVWLYLTRIICTTVTDLSNTRGKLSVLNDTVLHAS